MSHPIHRLATWQSAMFLVNSRLGRFSAALRGRPPYDEPPQRAPLLPKLRGQVAEFLNEGSLARLGILYLPTCVGLRYDYPTRSLGDFLGSRHQPLRPRRSLGSHSPLGVNVPADFPTRTSYRFRPRLPMRGRQCFGLLRPSITVALKRAARVR